MERGVGQFGDAFAGFLKVFVEQGLTVNLAVILTKVRARHPFPCCHFGRERLLDWAPYVADLLPGLLPDAESAVVNERFA